MKILLEGPILTNSGYGEHSRLVFRSLLEKIHIWDLEIFINPLEWGRTSWISNATEEKKTIDNFILKTAKYLAAVGNRAEYDMQIHVGIPSEFEKKAPYSVCVTAGIESTKVSPNWILKTFEGIDKIIVPSEHAKQSFLNPTYKGQRMAGPGDEHQRRVEEIDLSCNCPISVVPYPVKTFAETEPKLNIDFDTEFNFLTIAMLGPRKNLENTISWFVKEFRENDKVGLIIKTCMAKNCFLDREATKRILSNVLANMGEKERKCKVYLLHGNLEESEIHSLYKHEKIKAYLTATHGEGFGLPIFEAAYSGMPVIATNWSAHIEFLKGIYKSSKKSRAKETALFSKVEYRLDKIPATAVWENILVEDSQWAYPIEVSFRKQINAVYKNYGVHKKRARALQETILKTHHYDDISDQLAKELIPEHVRPDEKWIEDLSKIEII